MSTQPVIFTDGKQFFDTFAQTYKTHSKGLFILAPSGAGKTHFCKNQTEQNWIDGDDLWMGANAHPDYDWWNQPLDEINRVDKRSDVITMEAKYLGLWVMGASNFWLQPDAIVIPNWDVLVAQIENRQNTNYDGGATTDKLDQVKEHSAFIEKWHTDYGVPKFESINAAVEYLTRSL